MYNCEEKRSIPRLRVSPRHLIHQERPRASYASEDGLKLNEAVSMLIHSGVQRSFAVRLTLERIFLLLRDDVFLDYKTKEDIE
jgi:hypothetical protein